MKLLNRYRSLSDNTRNVLKNMVGAFGVKGLSLVVSLFTYPTYLEFFHNETALGLWTTILSVLTWMLTFDFGIGNGLRNHLAKCLGEKNMSEAKRYVSSAYVSIGGVCLAALGIFLALFRWINWNTVFNIETSVVSDRSLRVAVCIVFVGILLQMFLRNINSTLYALQLSSVNNMMTLGTSVLTLVTVLLMPSGSNDRNLIAMAVIHLLAVVIPQLIATLVVFVFSKYRAIAPSLKECKKSYAQKVLTLGGAFFFVQLVYMLIMNTNEYLITMYVGNEYVVEYSKYHKLFMLGSTVISLAMTPVWSAVTKAIAEKNYRWVKSLYKKMVLLGFVGTACEFLIIPFLQIGFNLWLGKHAITVHYGYAVAFAIMGSLMIFNSVLSSLANGLGKLRTQAVLFTLGAALKIPLAYVLVDVTGSWIGVLIANIVSMGLYCCIQPLTLRKLLRQLPDSQA